MSELYTPGYVPGSSELDVLPVFGDKSPGYTMVVFRQETINETFTTVILACTVPYMPTSCRGDNVSYWYHR